MGAKAQPEQCFIFQLPELISRRRFCIFSPSRGQVFWIVVVLSLAVLAGCSAPPGQETLTPPVLPADTPDEPAAMPSPIVITTKKDPATPVTVTMILSKAPRLNEPADLSLVIQSILDAPGTRAEFILPQSAEVESGDITWTGDLKANQPVTLSATIHFTQPGNLTVQGRALASQPNGDVWGDMATVYLNVTEQAGKVGFSNP